MKTYWAVYTPRGRVMIETITTAKRSSIYWAHGPWDRLQKEGYTVRKITIREESKWKMLGY